MAGPRGGHRGQSGQKKKVDSCANSSVTMNVFKGKQADMSPQSKPNLHIRTADANIAAPVVGSYYFPLTSNEQAPLSSNEGQFHYPNPRGDYPHYANYVPDQNSSGMPFFQAPMPDFGSCTCGMDLQETHEDDKSNQTVSQTPINHRHAVIEDEGGLLSI